MNKVTKSMLLSKMLTANLSSQDPTILNSDANAANTIIQTNILSRERHLRAADSDTQHITFYPLTIAQGTRTECD